MYANFEELAAYSDSIFNGKVVSYEDKVGDTISASPYRVFKVKVTEDFKGNHKVGDIVEVKQLHGKKNGLDYSESGVVLLETGNEYMAPEQAKTSIEVNESKLEALEN